MAGVISVNPWWAEGLLLQQNLSLEAIIEQTAVMGAEGFDMQEAYLGLSPHPDPVTLRHMRGLVHSFGMEMTSCWFYADVLGVAGLYSVETAVAYIQQYLAITTMLESRYLVIQNGEPSPGMSASSGRSLLLRIYEQIAPVAEAYGVIIGFEAARSLSPFNSPQGALALVKEFASPSLTMVPDFEAWRLPNQAMPVAYIENPGMKQPEPLTLEEFRACLPYAPFVHAKFLELNDAGVDPNYPAEELLAALVADSQTHDISVEYEGWLPEVHPERDPRQQTEKAVGLVKRILRAV